MVTPTAEHSLAWILPFVRKAFSQGGIISRTKYYQELWAELERANEPGIERASLVGVYGQVYNYRASPPSMLEAATDAFFYMIRKGYISPVPPTDFVNFAQPYEYHFTERGKAWLSDSDPLPELVEGYMEFLKKRVSPLDGVIEQYIREALRTFNDDSFFAAAVMLGAASEKAIYLLADALLVALKEPLKKAELANKLNDRSLLGLLTLVSTTLRHAASSKAKHLRIPRSESECISHLESLFDAIRVQRNEAVHPASGNAPPDSVRLLMHSFPYALEQTVKLQDWLHANPSSI